MGSNEELQKQEIQVLQSIYTDDFLESPPPRAWKGASRLPEFMIRVTHPDTRFSSKINFHLNIKFPKAYPTRAAPIFNIVQPIAGLSATNVSKLNSAIHMEAQKNTGAEMVFQIVTFCQDWIDVHVPPPIESTGSSLAIEMHNRALEQEKAMREREASLARAEDELAAQQAEELRRQIEEDVQRKETLQREERERHRARRRAFSDATEKPVVEALTETFEQEIKAFGLRFDTVKLYHGRQECLGITYAAEPICEDIRGLVPLELHLVTFESQYYLQHQGRKKLRQVEMEIQRLIKIDNCNVIRIYAVQLTFPKSNGAARLAILSEKKPALTLEDLLQDCVSLRENRASDYLAQILAGLNAIHSMELVHRGLRSYSIGLVDRSGGGKTVKLMKVAFYTKLHDLHKSEPFGPNLEADNLGEPMPDEWLTRETLESPLTYTRARDIHDVGVIVLQMSMGLDVMRSYSSSRLALQASSMSSSMKLLTNDMLNSSKGKNGNCIALLARLSEQSLSYVPTTRPITIDETRTPVPRTFATSPETSYFNAPFGGRRKASRWREDWEELELLGRGGFGSVVKAKNKIDGRIYAVKRIKLRTMQGDNKIFREVTALSRLSHRFIVRYYTTWLEESETASSNVSSDSEHDSDEESSGGATLGVEGDATDPFTIDFNDLDSGRHTSSFPSIHFTSGDVASADDSDEDDESSMYLTRLMNSELTQSAVGTETPPQSSMRTLYIQMEYVERQTLKERIAEGISEEESWRLVQQIVDALVHMSSLGILHRDIKLTNIFIDSNGDCKIGDFGLATSSLAAVDPSDCSPQTVNTATDMTLEVGTRLYIAPEVLGRRGGPRDQSKADMYSLGIVFFEMNYTFNTGAERITVLENLRLPDIQFPDSWDPKRMRQKQIIQWLLQHDPNERPSALQLSQSPLLPPRLEDEYFREALHMMTKPDSPHYHAVLSALFSQPPRPARGFLYDEDLPESATLRSGVEERLNALFRLHGAREVDVPLLMPLMKLHMDDQRQVLLLDSHGEIVTLPSNALLPFARLAARTKTTRIKRYHIDDIYRGGNTLRHPWISSAAVFDIISPDTVNGPGIAAAEIISMMHECLAMFPNMVQTYEIQISHSKISEIVLGRILQDVRASVVDILTQTKASASQKRALLSKKNLSRSMIDELEFLYENYDEWHPMMLRLERYIPTLFNVISPYMNEIKKTMELAALSRPSIEIHIRPLMIGRRHDLYKNGICFEVVKKNKKNDILATGGRYDHLISQFYPPLLKKEPFCAVGLQISLERITSAIATFQSAYLGNGIRDQRSYGFWSARRCDVYIVSFQSGQLNERLEVASLLWQNGISADLMYENAVADTTLEGLADLCSKEGILFTVYPRPKSNRRELADFKVKSVLKGAEFEVSKQDLVPWLQQQIAEQKRVDVAASGVETMTESAPTPIVTSKESNNNLDVHILLPGEGTNLKKQRRQTKQLFADRAYQKRMQLKTAMQSGNMPMVAVDVPPATFEAMTKNDLWVTDDDAWRSVASGFPTQHTAYASQIRECIARKKNDGIGFVILFAVKEERVALLSF